MIARGEKGCLAEKAQPKKEKDRGEDPVLQFGRREELPTTNPRQREEDTVAETGIRRP